MAKHEACELYIEQQIEEGLQEGKTPYSIGKELSDWVAKLFEVRIKPTTLEKRADRQRGDFPTNVGKESSPPIETSSYEPKVLVNEGHGGKREGSGRKKEIKSWNNYYAEFNDKLLELKIPLNELVKQPEWEKYKDNVIEDIHRLTLITGGQNE